MKYYGGPNTTRENSCLQMQCITVFRSHPLAAALLAYERGGIREVKWERGRDLTGKLVKNVIYVAFQPWLPGLTHLSFIF